MCLTPVFWRDVTPARLRRNPRLARDLFGLFVAETLNYIVAPYLDLVGRSVGRSVAAATLCQHTWHSCSCVAYSAIATP